MHSAVKFPKSALLSLVAALSLVCATTASAYSYKILVDDNQIYRTELPDAARVRCDGVWSIPGNSAGNLGRDIPISEWQVGYTAMGPGWVCTEDYQANFPNKNYNLTKDIVGASAISMTVVYAEPAIDGSPTTVISDATISSVYAQTGKKVIVLARAYNAAKWINDVTRALNNTKVGGVAFEVKPTVSNYQTFKIINGIKAVLNSGKKCFLLLPPNFSSVSNDYTADIVSVFNYIKNNSSASLNNSNLHFVLTCYNRNKDKTTSMYGGTNSVEGAIAKLKSLR